MEEELNLNFLKLVTKYTYTLGITASFAMSAYIIDFYAKKSLEATNKKEKELNEKLEKYKIRGNKNSSDEDSMDEIDRGKQKIDDTFEKFIKPAFKK